MGRVRGAASDLCYFFFVVFIFFRELVEVDSCFGVCISASVCVFCFSLLLFCI